MSGRMKEQSLIQGNILRSLLSFAFPVLLALFLQAMYGAADLMIVGKFAGTGELSGVATGSQLLNMITMVITGLTTGVTVFVGDAGAAIATVAAQGVSVLFSLYFIRTKQLPFPFSRQYLRAHGPCVKRILLVGVPIALQELLVQFSFLFIQAVVNGMGVAESAAVGVAEKVCAFLMLVASAYMQSISAFVAQNNGALRPERSRQALFYGIRTALAAGAVMGAAAFFGGDVLASIFSRDPLVIASAHEYLEAYAIDCLLTAILFCFVGYFNGCGKTLFVMAQGVIGAFCVRIPTVYLMSRLEGATLFHIGLGTPISSTVQITLCVIAYNVLRRTCRGQDGTDDS